MLILLVLFQFFRQTNAIFGGMNPCCSAYSRSCCSPQIQTPPCTPPGKYFLGFPPPYCPPGTVCYPLYPPCPVPGSVGGPYALRGTKLDDRAKAIEIPDEMELRAAAFGVQLDKRSHKSAVFEALHKLGDLKEQENQSVEVPDKIVFISQAADQLTSGEIHKISQNSRKDSNGVSFSYQTDEVKSQTVQVPKKPKKTEDQDLSVSYPIGLGEVKKIHRKKKKESRDMVSGISRQVITPEIRRAPRDLKEDKTTEAPVQVTTVKDEESKSLDDNKCNSQVLKKLMMDLMNESSSESKKKINSAAEERFGGNVDVVCSRGHFSYVFSSSLYCEATKGLMTCIAYRQPSL